MGLVRQHQLFFSVLFTVLALLFIRWLERKS